MLWIIGAFPEEIAALRKYSAHVEKLRQNIKAPAVPKVLPKAERDKTIVDMYINGHSFDDIWVASGFSSKSSIWRILNKYGVKLDRGQTSGPRVKQNPKEDNACAMENIFLAARSYGVGSVWINQMQNIHDRPAVRALLNEIGVPADHVIYGVAALGYADPSVPVEPKERTGKVVYVK